MVNLSLFKSINKALDKYALIKSDSGIWGHYVYDICVLIPDNSQFNTKYSLIVSSKWLDGNSRSEILKELLPHLRSELSDDSYYKINRVVPISTEDSFVKNSKLVFSPAFTSENSILEINNIYLGEYEIEQAYIIKLNNQIKENA